MEKFKNLEQIWASLKSKMPSFVQITKIEKDTGNIKQFEVIIPKSRIENPPKGTRNKDLEFIISYEKNKPEIYLTNNKDYLNFYSLDDLINYLLNIIDEDSVNESKKDIDMKVEDNDEFKGLDKLITFDAPGLTQKDIQSKLDKTKKKFFLEVYPTKKVGLYVAKTDEAYFKQFINLMLDFKVNEGAIAVVGLLQHIDKDFVSTLSDDGLKNAINQLETDIGVQNMSDDDDSKIYHRDAQEKFDIIANEFRKRGLPVDNESYLSEALDKNNKSKLFKQSVKIGDEIKELIKLVENTDSDDLNDIINVRDYPFDNSLDDELVEFRLKIIELSKLFK